MMFIENLPLLRMAKIYKGEEKNGVIYFPKETLNKENLFIHFHQGLIYSGSSDRNESSILTEDSRIDSKGRTTGLYEFVLNSNNEFLAVKKGPKQHSSSLVNGRDVKIAFSATIKNGKFIKINDQSGHYQPTLPYMLLALEKLQAEEVDLGYAELIINGFIDSVNNTLRFEQIDCFLKTYRDGFNNKPRSISSLQELSKLVDTVEKNKASEVLGTYYVPSKNELYELSLSNGNLLCTSYYELYNAMVEKKLDVQFNQNEDQFSPSRSDNGLTSMLGNYFLFIHPSRDRKTPPTPRIEDTLLPGSSKSLPFEIKESIATPVGTPRSFNPFS